MNTLSLLTPKRADSGLRQSILRTVIYFDMFDYPPTAQEIQSYLESPSSHQQTVMELSELSSAIVQQGGLYALKGREEIFAVRSKRRILSAKLWRQSLPWLRLTQAIPFLRFVGISGSLAIHNANPEADVDLFFIASPNHLKVSYFFLCVLRKLCRNFTLCTSLGLEMDALAVSRKNIYTAHEIHQVRPIWGHEAYALFLSANEWSGQFLPNAPSRQSSGMIMSESRPLALIRAALELMLRGRFNPLPWVLIAGHQWNLRRKKIACTKIDCFQNDQTENQSHQHHGVRIIKEFKTRLQKHI
ncbi:MAG: hypothetical protein HY547_02265 [Elusimicrobia bacterium]|nr:hypothetical protein [Elusimicrobiota bacterium]